MGFQGYKLRHKMAIYHINGDDPESSTTIVRNLDMNVFILSDSSRFYRFEEMERQIAWALKRFTERPIDEITPFTEQEPTLENIGIVFFNLIKESLAIIEIPVDRLEISENLIRTFVVTESDNTQSLLADGKKINITDLFMSDYISSSAANLISVHHAKNVNAGSDFLQDKSQFNLYNNFEERIPTNDTFDSAVRDAGEAGAPDEAAAYKKSGVKIEKLTNKTIGRKRYIQVFSAFSLLTAMGLIFSLYLYNRGLYPSGADIYGHLFKSDLLYNSIREGDFYPLYTNLWYNGLQPFRYWAPLPYYILALMQFLTGGNVLLSYILFTGFSLVAGGAGWLLWGIYNNRLFLCTFLAIMWFFLPDNMRVFFVEGNLPRMVIAVFLPYLFFFVWKLADKHKKNASIPIILIMCAIILCHVMIAAMIGISTFIFLLIYSVGQRRVKESLYVICLMLVSFALCGLWLYPALQGGLVSMDASATAEVMKALSTPVTLSLNPFIRDRGLHEMFYFGISVFIISIFGFIMSDKKVRSGYLTVILVFIGTLPVVVPFLDKLPLNQLLWMTRFTPIVYAIFILSLLEWKGLKRYVILIFAFILILDSIPSLDFHKYHSLKPSVFSYTINEGKKITSQRISLMDLSAYGSYPSFGISTEEPKTPYTFGWAWQGASTAYNIMMKNTALERGYYTYLFDRCLELGDDIVLIQKQQIDLAKQTLESLLKGAADSNYYLVEETNEVYIFRCNAPKTFGTVTDYRGLTVGKSANLIALEYPVFEEGMKDEITEYTLEEIRKYDVIYLSGFTYKDKKMAEELLVKAAYAGVKVIVDMNRIPADSVTNRMSFLGVNAQPISFFERFPEMIYKGDIYEPKPFGKELKEWNTVYLEDLDKPIAYSWVEGKLLPFVGNKKHENITLLGYNVLFHGMETKDEAIIRFFSDITGFSRNIPPKRTIVPLSVCYENDRIIVDSSYDGVNTTIGFQDTFRSAQNIESQTNLLMVKKGITIVELIYPYLKEGFFLSLAGVIITIFLLKVIYKKGGKTSEAKTG